MHKHGNSTQLHKYNNKRISFACIPSAECLVCHQSFMRKPLLIAHMRTQQHGEDEFIHNKPDFAETRDNNNLRNITNNDTITTEEDDDANDIIYLSVNDRGFIEDDDGDIDEDDDGDGHFVVSGWVVSIFIFGIHFFLCSGKLTFHTLSFAAHIERRAHRGRIGNHRGR